MSLAVTMIDYGAGNLHSVKKAFRECGAEVSVTDEPAAVKNAELLVLPGVGAFADGMRGLRKKHLIEALDCYFARQRPFLGICLGMQMLLTNSDEFGSHSGLGVISGQVVRIPTRPDMKVPHMGWSRIRPRPGGSWAGSLLKDTPVGSRFYFVHSFSAEPESEENRLADADYGGFRISAAVRQDNIIGCQFHPEMSGPLGLELLRHFLEI